MKLPFFKFDSNEWLTGNIRFCTPEEQGIFIDLCALIWKDGGTYKINNFTHRQCNTSQQVFNMCQQVLEDAGLILNNNGVLSVKFLSEQLEAHAEVCEKRAHAGRKSAEKRASIQQVSTIKKEESRKKKEESRKKKEESRKKKEEGEAHAPDTPPFESQEDLSEPAYDAFSRWYNSRVPGKIPEQRKWRANISQWCQGSEQQHPGHGVDIIQAVFEWGIDNYLEPPKPANFFVTDQWPGLYGMWKKSPYRKPITFEQENELKENKK